MCVEILRIKLVDCPDKMGMTMFDSKNPLNRTWDEIQWGNGFDQKFDAVNIFDWNASFVFEDMETSFSPDSGLRIANRKEFCHVF